MACCAAEHVHPEYIALGVCEVALHVFFVTRFAADERHGRLLTISPGEFAQCLRTLGSIVAAAHQLEVIERRVFTQGTGRFVAALETFERVEIAEIADHLTPVALSILGLGGHLAARDQNERVGCISGNEIAPVALESLDARHLHRVAVGAAPGPYQSRQESPIHEMFETTIRVVEVLRIEVREFAVPIHHPTLVCPAGIEGLFVWIGPADDLHRVEPLRPAIGAQFLESLPAQTLAQSLPPSVGEPEKRCAVSVLKVALVCRDLQGAVFVQGVVTGVGCDLYRSFHTV